MKQKINECIEKYGLKQTTETLPDLMLDIETLGIDPGCVVLSIGAVEFDLDSNRIGKTFYSKISLKDSLKQGLTINADTLKWWLKQSPELLNEMVSGENSVSRVLNDFYLFMNYNKNWKVWGNSNRFDIGIVNALYATLNKKSPINYRFERDVRTLLDLNKKIKDNIEFVGSTHNPIYDCLHQIKYCQDIKSSIHINTPKSFNIGSTQTADLVSNVVLSENEFHKISNIECQSESKPKLEPIKITTWVSSNKIVRKINFIEYDIDINDFYFLPTDQKRSYVTKLIEKQFEQYYIDEIYKIIRGVDIRLNHQMEPFNFFIKINDKMVFDSVRHISLSRNYTKTKKNIEETVHSFLKTLLLSDDILNK